MSIKWVKAIGYKCNCKVDKSVEKRVQKCYNVTIKLQK